MSRPVDDRLQRLLGGERLAPLRRRLRRRFERAPVDKPLSRIRVDRLTAEEHETLAALLGRPQKYSESLGIDLRSVDLTLQQAGIAASLHDALERLDGPIAHPAAARVRLQALWSNVVEDFNDAGLAGLLAQPTGLGLLKRLAKQHPPTAAELCRRAKAVLRRLPADGVTRSQLAADVLGDAHALDNGEAVATLVLAVRRRLASPGCHGASPRTKPSDEQDTQQSAERARDVWAAAGVLVNELARPALFLNLPTTGAEPGEPGEPGYLSLRSLLRSPPRWDVSDRKVFVCENPNLVAIAADRLGRGCAPLMCTDGMPSAAQRTLLHQLVQAGASLHYHGDFDWPGLRIANHVIREHGARPWRLGTTDYLTAIGQAPSDRQFLKGAQVMASWDEALTTTMAENRIAIAEEAQAGELLEDLHCR
ncbi:MAG TPA: TIGR02679 family protein [Dongiaceae bacterium]|nr:TIGR02679 family protein [Dongiaceae bacterium]